MKAYLSSLMLSVLLGFYSTNIYASSAKMTDAAKTAVLEQMSSLGVASVIVDLETNSLKKEQVFGVAFEDAERQAVVQSLVDSFENSLQSTDGMEVTHKYQYVPSAVVQLTGNTLQELEDNPLVKGVYPNVADFASLAESVDRVYPNHSTSKFNGNNEWAVVVIDSGSDTSHSFLQSNGVPKVISEACYSGGGISDPRVVRVCPGGVTQSVAAGSGRHCSALSLGCDHGTHVAGIAVGDRDNSFVDGVASKGKLIPMQVFTIINDVQACGGDPSCLPTFRSDYLKALERAYALRNTHKIAAVNMSLGGGRFFSSCDSENPPITNIINLLKSAGIATVVASGNDGFGTSISFPACISNAIAVASADDSDRESLFSNVDSTIDIFAPGENIISSVPNQGFASFRGTSMAAPHVAGAFAVLKQGLPNASVNQLLSVLKSVGPDVTMCCGNGVRKRLDVSAALTSLGLFNSVTLAPILQLLLLD